MQQQNAYAPNGQNNGASSSSSSFSSSALGGVIDIRDAVARNITPTHIVDSDYPLQGIKVCFAGAKENPQTFMNMQQGWQLDDPKL